MTGEVVIPGRPDLAWYSSRQGKQPFMSRAKKFPKYVHGVCGNSALIHTIAYVNLRWYRLDSGGNNLILVNEPIMRATCICGTSFRLSAKSGVTCEIPKPDAVMCGRCNGQMPPFSKRNPNRLDIKAAKKALGCIVEGV
jgi:hypothetical protein